MPINIIFAEVFWSIILYSQSHIQTVIERMRLHTKHEMLISCQLPVNNFYIIEATNKKLF